MSDLPVYAAAGVKLDPDLVQLDIRLTPAYHSSGIETLACSLLHKGHFT